MSPGRSTNAKSGEDKSLERDFRDLQLLGGGWGSSSSRWKEKLGIAEEDALKGTNQPDHASPPEDALLRKRSALNLQAGPSKPAQGLKAKNALGFG